MEKVSIITPSFNSKKYFLETYKSVVAQTYENFEWIIVDDCSSDGSYEFIKNLIKDDSRVKLQKLDRNSGTAKARNLGLKCSSGRFVTFLDADDMIDKNYLENQVNFMVNNGPIISSGYRRITGKSTTNFYVPPNVSYKDLLKTCSLSCLTTMYDKQIIGDCFFPENMKKAEDYPFWLNILKKGYVAKGNPEVLASYRILEGSRSRNKLSLARHIFYVYHTTQSFGFLKSLFFVFRWAFNGLIKYKTVK